MVPIFSFVQWILDPRSNGDRKKGGDYMILILVVPGIIYNMFYNACENSIKSCNVSWPLWMRLGKSFSTFH